MCSNINHFVLIIFICVLLFSGQRPDLVHVLAREIASVVAPVRGPAAGAETATGDHGVENEADLDPPETVAAALAAHAGVHHVVHADRPAQQNHAAVLAARGIVGVAREVL